VLSSEGSYCYEDSKKDWILETGDPTEVALLVLGGKTNITRESLQQEYILKKNVPFSNQKMRHSTLYQNKEGYINFHTRKLNLSL
jgi:Ca2+-transporting ATPase